VALGLLKESHHNLILTSTMIRIVIEWFSKSYFFKLMLVIIMVCTFIIINEDTGSDVH
jgi:hypothetical protein